MAASEKALRRLISWREKLERDALAAFAAVQQRLMAQEQQLDDLRRWRRSYVAQEQQRGAGLTLRGSELGRSRAFLASLDRGVEHQAGLLARTGDELEHCRNRWVHARSELRVAELLLERRLHERRKRAVQLERIALDEHSARTERRPARASRVIE